MFLEEIQRTLQERQLQSRSHKQFVLDKLDVSIFLAWILQQYDFSELKLASDKNHRDFSVLSNRLCQLSLVCGGNLVTSINKFSMQRLFGSPSVCCRHHNFSCLPQIADISDNMCHMVELKNSVAEINNNNNNTTNNYNTNNNYNNNNNDNNNNINNNNNNNNPFVRETESFSAFTQIPCERNSSQKIWKMNENQLCFDKCSNANRNHQLCSSVSCLNKTDIDQKTLSDDSPDNLTDLKKCTCPHSPSLPLTPQPRRLSQNANQTEFKECSNYCYYYTVPPLAETISVETGETFAVHSKTLMSDSLSSTSLCHHDNQPVQNERDAHLYHSRSVFPDVRSTSADLHHSFNSSCSLHVWEERLDEECNLYMLDQIQPQLQRNLENPIAKLLSTGDDMHFIPIGEELMLKVRSS
ncbi:Hypothetical predicted protein [Octopus vulgaris]|uniref:Uncharacterized protein n=1 Tax=Octopus vulgaris TaxID=6645 RepID=A0AA36BL14_OCTVU|nr:Hypothetical predicted protein [Octopus vulgaris]